MTYHSLDCIILICSYAFGFLFLSHLLNVLNRLPHGTLLNFLPFTTFFHQTFPKNQNMNKLHQQNLSWLQLVGGGESQSFDESPFNEAHVFPSIEESRDDESRSYNPYLIAYHEDTNSFTYNDPWVQLDLASHSSNNDNETNLNVTSNEVQIAHESVPVAQEQINCDAIDNGTDFTEKVTQHLEVVPPKTVEVVVEHVPKVSFPHDEHLLEATGDSNSHLFPPILW